MDKNEYEDKKSRIKNNETEILNAIIDMNYADNSQIHDIKAKLYQIEADCIAIGEYYEQAGSEEENKRKYGKVLEAQETAIKQNVENDNRRTEIAEESLELQKRNAEIQEELIQSQKESVVRQTERDKIAFETEQKMMTALESIAYSLAKLTVNSSNQNEDFKTVGAITEFVK